MAQRIGFLEKELRDQMATTRGTHQSELSKQAELDRQSKLLETASSELNTAFTE